MMKYVKFKYPVIAGIMLFMPMFFCSNNAVRNLENKVVSERNRTDSLWVDSVFKSLTPDQRIAQLFMVPAYSNRGPEHIRQVRNLIKEHNIGGVIFMQGGPHRQALMCNSLQDAAQTPLLVSIDGEWGLAMRLDSTISFPKQMTLGAIRDPIHVYYMGAEVARQCQRIGIHINFAPVVDVNNNRRNPVINYRSFGEDMKNVALKGAAYAKGMQDNRVIACAKHFPGHGDTDTDSHYALPVIKHSRERIDSLELFPFRTLINSGVISIMVAHLHIPALDSEKGSVTTLSKNVVTTLLRDSLNFKGLAITDALNMGGVVKGNDALTIDVRALLAGNDILLFPQNVKTGIQSINKAIEDGLITRQEVDKRVKRVLYAKYWAGLAYYSSIGVDNIVEELNTPEAIALNQKLAEKSLTVLKNNDNLLPLKNLDTLKIASLSIGLSEKTDFQKMMDLYTKVGHYNLAENAAPGLWLLEKLSSYNTLIIGIHARSQSPSRKFGMPASVNTIIEKLSGRCRIIVNLMGNPYGLAYIDDVSKIDALVVSYERDKVFQEASAQFIFGAIGADGKLPVTAGHDFKVGDGLVVPSLGRLGYTVPERLGIKSEWLLGIDSIARNGIAQKAFPGCQILAAKDGKVFYYKSFGHHTYDEKTEVKNSDIYDLASITKICATTVSLMKLVDDSLISIDGRLIDYLPETNGTAVASLRIKDILAHRARLRAWIPFYVQSLKNGAPSDSIYSNKQTEVFSVKVADNLYMRQDYIDTIFSAIFERDLRPRAGYLYSDLGFITFAKVIQNLYGMPIDKFLNTHFFNEIGATTLGYNPLDRFDRENIVPTEDDKTFRRQLVHGYVHDPAAAMKGGVSGHAGLFSNANDLAKIMQMLMMQGNYGGKQYISAETINCFNTCHFRDNRRGLGFDKREASGKGSMYAGVSNQSFGHTGFTGTIAWADPHDNIVYIFLSNRIHPNQENRKINQLNIRAAIQQEIYTAIRKAKKEEETISEK